jgi:lycopene beta-cyclase
MRCYDYILAGGGTAGLSLAYRLLDSPLSARSILLVDQDLRPLDDRTWGFWTDQPTQFDEIVYRSWDTLRVKDEFDTKILPLHTYRYKVIRRNDFYRRVQQKLLLSPNVDLLEGKIERIEDNEHHVSLVVEGQHYTGQWVFDSRFQEPTSLDGQPGSITLKQQFKGWEIETDKGCFDPQIVTFFDFSIPQEQGVSFFYILPFSERRALVMFVLWTTTPVYWNVHNLALQDYIQGTLGIKEYHLLREECGVTLLTDYLFPRRPGKHTLTLGKQGGRVKASTGYAFMRIQQDTSAIVNSLLTTGHPFAIPPSHHRYRFFDSALLEIMVHHPERIKSILTALLMNLPVEQVLRFLDERSTFWADLSMLPALPPGLLFQAIRHLGTFSKV